MNIRPLILVGLLLGTGCASQGTVQQLQTQVDDLQDELNEIRRRSSSKEDVERLNESIAKQNQALLKSNADLSVKVSEVDDRLQNSQGTIEQTNYRIDRLVQQVTQLQRELTDLRQGQPAGTPPAGGSPAEETVNVPAPATDDEDPLETYQSAYRDYQRGNFDLAIQGFRDYLKGNPATDLSDNAAYWIGESLFSQKKYREAVEQFDRVINGFPKSDKVPAALLKKGYAYIELGEKAQGIVQLQYVVHEHPRSQEASLAKQKLRSLGIDSK